MTFLQAASNVDLMSLFFFKQSKIVNQDTHQHVLKRTTGLYLIVLCTWKLLGSDVKWHAPGDSGMAEGEPEG